MPGTNAGSVAGSVAEFLEHDGQPGMSGKVVQNEVSL